MPVPLVPNRMIRSAVVRLPFLICPSFDSSHIIDLSDSQERVVLLSVVDWSGEERAKLAVRGSDSVLDGQLQIKDQTGVETSAQRLVLGELELKPSMKWGSIPGWLDGTTVQLTVVNDYKVKKNHAE